MSSQQRGRRSTTAALGLTTVLTTLLTAGCGTSSHPAAPAVTARPVATSSALVINTRGTTAGTTALAEAVSATQALRAYSFSAQQDIGGTRLTRSTLTGRAIRPSSVDYVLTANGKRTQVLRLAKATYLKVGTGRWFRAKSASSAVDPVSSLINLLRAVHAPTVAGTARPSVLHGVIPAAQARAAGLAAGSGSADVTITLDARHRVTRVEIRTNVTRPGNAVAHVSMVTVYGSFNAVPPMKPPV